MKETPVVSRPVPCQDTPARARPLVGTAASAVIAASLAALALHPGLAPLPALGWAALFLFWVVQQDLARTRIPNALTFPALTLALLHGMIAHGWSGLGWGLAGAGLVLAILWVPFSVRALAAGDVKG